MSEEKLTRLQNATPSARADAKRAALSAALDAFDAAEAKKDSDATQGKVFELRHSNVSTRKKGGLTMRSVTKFNPALAASLAAMLIAGPTAWYAAHQREDARLQLAKIEEQAAQVAAAPSSSPQPAPIGELLGTVRAPAPSPPHPAPLGGVAAEQTTVAARLHEMRASASAKKAKAGAAGDAMRSVAQVVAQAQNMSAVMTPPETRRTKLLVDKPEVARGDESSQRAVKESRDKFPQKEPSPVKSVAAEPVSTFSLAVDTASYAFARRMVNAGQLPPKDSVRAEEFINYFPYSYPQPTSADAPFKPTVTITPSPWNAHNKLVHVAVQGYTLHSAQRPRANLVLLMDVSGSMMPQDRLPLVKNAMRLLVDELQPDDTIGVVTYADGSGVVLEPTRVAEREKILSAIASLGAGGSTAGAQGIIDAYRLAETHFDKSAVNRIILSTDGDFNVGVTDPRELQAFVERKRKSGIFLSILGVGQDNYNDALMQKLAQHGNGVAAYVDTLNEARKVLVEQASSTLFPIAKDVKIQMEWNPARVSEYRLIGYETRNLKREDFNNDEVAAGNIGSGLTVTAIYEITPAGAEKKLDDELRYAKKGETHIAEPASGEWGFLKLRYKLPKEETSRLITLPIDDSMAKKSLAETSDDVRFSIAAAAYAQLLEGAPYLKGYGYDEVAALAQGAKGEDRFGYRAEFVNLVRLAKSAQP